MGPAQTAKKNKHARDPSERVCFFLLVVRVACFVFFGCLGGEFFFCCLGRVDMVFLAVWAAGVFFFFAVWAGGFFCFCCLGGGREFPHLPVCLARL